MLADFEAILQHLSRVDVQSTDGYREYWADSWEISIQDEGRTLKLFAKGTGAQAKASRNESLAELIKDNPYINPYIHSEGGHAHAEETQSEAARTSARAPGSQT